MLKDSGRWSPAEVQKLWLPLVFLSIAHRGCLYALLLHALLVQKYPHLLGESLPSLPAAALGTGVGMEEVRPQHLSYRMEGKMASDPGLTDWKHLSGFSRVPETQPYGHFI